MHAVINYKFASWERSVSGVRWMKICKKFPHWLNCVTKSTWIPYMVQSKRSPTISPSALTGPMHQHEIGQKGPYISWKIKCCL